MRRRRGINALRGAGICALATCLVAAPVTPASAQAAGDMLPARHSREMSFAVPLVQNQRVLGDVIVHISATGEITYESQSMQRELGPLLNDEGKRALDAAVAGQAFLTEAQIAPLGVSVSFSADRLEVIVQIVDGRYRPVGNIGDPRSDDSGATLPTIEPADFSAYLNVNGNLEYDGEEGLRKPDLYLFGAARYQNVVLELDGAVSDQFGEDYRFYRRSARAIYDIPQNFQRLSAGDLQTDTIPLLPTPIIGGIGIERRKRTFDPFLPTSRLGGRQIYLETSSTVDVMINGVRHETLQLDAGQYDLANLPLRFGSNNLQFIVRDAAGREQVIDYSYFFEPLDLDVGDYEYAASIGMLAKELSYEPNYSGDIGAIAYYRKAFTEEVMLGGAVQLSEDVQVFAAEANLVPQVVPGIFDFQAALKTGDGTAYALRAGYRWRSESDGERRRQLNLTVDYQSRNFQSIDAIFRTEFSTLNLNASYTQAFSLETYGTAGLSYTRQGGPTADSYVAYAELAHILSNRFRIVGGAEYGKDSFYGANIGARIGISLLFGGGHRVTADYRSRTGSFNATASRGADEHVGSWGYDIGLSDSRGDSSADASLNYVGNRFDARATVFTRGDELDGIGDKQRARLQVGSSLAFADGLFGIGRPIGESFAVLKPHSAIEGRDVITGRGLRNDEYEARSGPFGAAVQGRLSSYSPQNVQFDLAGLGTGYDIGDGVVRVEPPFHSGFKVIVGNDRFISAVGSLVMDGEPLVLVSGQLTSVDDEGFEAQPFFTNSVGRFGIFGLAPGKTYLVTLAGSARTLRIEVPQTNDGLYRLGTVEMARQGQ